MTVGRNQHQFGTVALAISFPWSITKGILRFLDKLTSIPIFSFLHSIAHRYRGKIPNLVSDGLSLFHLIGVRHFFNRRYFFNEIDVPSLSQKYEKKADKA